MNYKKSQKLAFKVNKSTYQQVLSISVVFYLFSTFLILLSTLFTNAIFYSSLKIICWSALLYGLFTIIITLYLSKQSLFSFLSIYLFGLYVFTFSSCWIYIKHGVPSFSFVFKLTDLVAYQIAIPYYLLAFNGIFFGAIITLVHKKRNREYSLPKYYDLKLDVIKKIGYLMYVISIVFTIILILQGRGLAIMLNEGYGAYRMIDQGSSSNFTDKYLATILTWFIPWGTLFIISMSKTSKKYVKNVIIFGLPAILLIFLSGDRTAPLILIGLFFSLAYIKGYIKKYNISKIVIIGGGIFLLIPLVGGLRGTPSKEWTVEKVSKILFGEELSLGDLVLSELAINSQSLGGTLKIVPSKEPFRYGYDYLKGVYVGIPFSNYFFPLPEKYNFEKYGDGIHPKPTRWFTYKYGWNAEIFKKAGKVTGLGYHQIAEAYLQGGALAILILFFLMGFFLTSIWKKIINSSPNLNMQYALYMSFIMQPIFAWIRNDSIEVFRYFFYGYLFIYIIPNLLVVIFKKI